MDYKSPSEISEANRKNIIDLAQSSEWTQKQFIHFLLSYICYPSHILSLPFQEWLSGEYLEELVESKQADTAEMRASLDRFKSLGKALLVLNQDQ